jgi:predicted O-linked N-acetylglucosamine transferase (SPINDLY family)
VSWVANLILHLGLVGLAGLSVACNDEARTREEARKLFEALSGLQDEASLVTREQSLRTLEALTLTVPAHQAARDACVTAHRELLSAEAEQASARKALEEATRESGNAPLPAERAAAIANAIEHSNAALERAEHRFPPCEQAMQKLLTAAR